MLADGTNEGGQDLSRSESSEPIFGLPLQDAVRISRISPSVGVPAVVTRCIEYLDIMGVEEVGLYRVPGSTSNVARLKTMFDHGKEMHQFLGGHWSCYCRALVLLTSDPILSGYAPR